ncbi:MAG: metallophosphoesterase [bacterium]|nr:metallophosphoesterase [bacterium]
MKQNRFLQNLLLLFLILCVAFLSFSCSKDSKDKDPVGPVDGSYPSITIGIFSDLHYYDPALGTNSDAFADYLAQDRKMLAESQAILEAAINMMLSEPVEVVLVPGDLTKDGEKQSHEQVAAYLAQLEASGKIVYVIPGNHDIQNPHAFSYPDGSDPVPVATVTPQEFKTIYNQFGFEEAIASDPNSLSYIAQPKDSIWVLAIDGCNYNSKFPELSRIAGDLKPETMTWIKSKLQEAQSSGITVFGMMHHGLVEHFPSMDAVFPDYLIYNWRDKAKQLAAAGLKIIFTGHHHANDIAQLTDAGNYVIDVQTGATVTWPCPIRIAAFDGENNTLEIITKHIESINFNTGGVAFQDYAKNFLATGLPPIVIAELQTLGMDHATATQFAQLVVPTLMAYYYGDEPLHQDPAVLAGINQVMSSGDPLAFQFGMLLLGIWNDPTPDNSVTIDFATGKISEKTSSPLFVFK